MGGRSDEGGGEDGGTFDGGESGASGFCGSFIIWSYPVAILSGAVGRVKLTDAGPAGVGAGVPPAIHNAAAGTAAIHNAAAGTAAIHDAAAGTAASTPTHLFRSLSPRRRGGRVRFGAGALKQTE